MFEEEEEQNEGGMIPKMGHRGGGWKRLEMEMRWSEEDERGLLRCVEKGLEEVCGEEEEVMMRVSFNAYDVYRLNGECGEVEVMRYEVYKSAREESCYVVVGDGCVDKRQFRRLVEKMGGEEKEEEKEERRSSLVASRNELETVEDMRDILSYIKSCYYEHKRCGYKSLLAKLGKKGRIEGEEEGTPNNLKGVVSDGEWKAIQQRITEAKKQGGGEEEEILEMMKMDIEGSDDLTLLVVLCLKKMRGEKRMEILMERKGMKRKEERKLVFDFGVLSRKRAEEIVGEGMVGRYLMYESESGDKKIIEYHSWSLEGGKYFKEYEIGEEIEGEEVWYELSRKGMLWYEAVVYKSGMERVIERVLDKV